MPPSQPRSPPELDRPGEAQRRGPPPSAEPAAHGAEAAAYIQHDFQVERTMTTYITRRRWPAALTAALTAALVLLPGCGGGGGGIGSGGTGAATMGTVDGFGSIFIGGERCDDVGARIEFDTVAGGPEPAQAEVKLGQRVEADLDGSR